MNLINQEVYQRPECSYVWCHNIEMPQMYRYTSRKLCMRHYRVSRNNDIWKRSDLESMLELQKQGDTSYDYMIREAMLDLADDTGHKCTKDRYGYGACGNEILKLRDGTFICCYCKTTYHIRKPEPLPPLFKCKFCNSGLLILGGGRRTCVNCRSEFELITEETDKIQTFVLITVRRNY